MFTYNKQKNQWMIYHRWKCRLCRQLIWLVINLLLYWSDWESRADKIDTVVQMIHYEKPIKKKIQCILVNYYGAHAKEKWPTNLSTLYRFVSFAENAFAQQARHYSARRNAHLIYDFNLFIFIISSVHKSFLIIPLLNLSKYVCILKNRRKNKSSLK